MIEFSVQTVLKVSKSYALSSTTGPLSIPLPKPSLEHATFRQKELSKPKFSDWYVQTGREENYKPGK